MEKIVGNEVYLRTKDYSVSGEPFQLLIDEELDMLVTDPRPSDLSSYYESEDYISHTDADRSFMDKVYQFVKRFNIRGKLNLISRYAGGRKTVLDIGAGTGDFLVFAKNKGWDISGVEPNSGARQRAAQKNVVLLKNILSLPSNTSYEIITLWHVLEHLPDLEGQIRKIVSLMEESGSLVVAVPNFKSFDAIHYGEFWAGYDVPRHLWHFSKPAISKLFYEHGLNVVRVKPLIFDSFYVSQLSEKYKTGKQNFLRAFFVGLWSNLVGMGNGQYSSLVYVLQKR